MIGYIERVRKGLFPEQQHICCKLVIKRSLVWIISLILNFLPIVIEGANGIKYDTYKGVGGLFESAIDSTDFLYVMISGLFVLFIEGYVSDGSTTPLFKIWQVILCIIEVLLIVGYTFLVTEDGVLSIIFQDGLYVANMRLLAFVLVFGIVSIVYLSLEDRQ